MTSPNSTLSTHRPDLASFVEYDVEASWMGLIGAQIFPFHAVDRVAGNFGRVTLKSLTQTIETERAPGSGYNRSKWEFEKDTYSCQEHGQEEPIDDRQAAMYSDYFRSEVYATLRARNSVLVNHEKRVQAIMAGASNSFNGSNWGDLTNGTPIADVDTAVQNLYDRGIMANALVISWKVFRNIIRSDEVIASLESSGAGVTATAGSMNLQKLAEALNIDTILVGSKQTNSDATAANTNTLAGIWGDDKAYVTKIAMTEDIAEPCCGRTFHFTGDGSEEGAHVESYRDETVRSDIIRARMDTDEKLLYDDAIEVIDTINA